MATNGVRTRNIFDPASREPFRLSRSKLQLFLDCPRCFHLDRRLGIGRPDAPPFTLNVAVDALLKREFDDYRARGEPHPIMRMHGVDAVPFRHPGLDGWRDSRTGVRHEHSTGFLVYGAVDDVWVTPAGELIVVDYKATSTEREITLDDEWRDPYKRQMEVYQWLLRRNGFSVSGVGYFVYANARKDLPAFDKRLEFRMLLLPYAGSDAWVDDALAEAHACLSAPKPPAPTGGCEWCAYRRAARSIDAWLQANLQINNNIV